jgi:hypothetical protein
MRRAAIVFSVVLVALGCNSSSSSDAGTDAGIGDCGTTTDASFSCDVSSVAQAQLGCGDWLGPATPNTGDSGGYSCPVAVDWFSSLSGTATGMGSMCEYTWDDSTTSPNLCDLPQSETGAAAFTWLHPVCGCL